MEDTVTYEIIWTDSKNTLSTYTYKTKRKPGKAKKKDILQDVLFLPKMVRIIFNAVSTFSPAKVYVLHGASMCTYMSGRRTGNGANDSGHLFSGLRKYKNKAIIKKYHDYAMKCARKMKK